MAKNVNGNITLAQSYTPFGEVMESAGSGSSAFGYTGEQMDETGLLFLRARYYAPERGTFLSVDPFAGWAEKPYSQHPYQYGYSNPLRYTDPMGRFTEAAIAEFYEVDDVKDVWWWDDPAYADFQDMILTAEAGDLLIHDCPSNAPCYHRFEGYSNSLLTGVSLTDGHGVLRTDILAKYQASSLNRMMTDQSWHGFVRWTGGVPSFYTRLGYNRTDYEFRSEG